MYLFIISISNFKTNLYNNLSIFDSPNLKYGQHVLDKLHSN